MWLSPHVTQVKTCGVFSLTGFKYAVSFCGLDVWCDMGYECRATSVTVGRSLFNKHVFQKAFNAKRWDNL